MRNDNERTAKKKVNRLYRMTVLMHIIIVNFLCHSMCLIYTNYCIVYDISLYLGRTHAEETSVCLID